MSIDDCTDMSLDKCVDTSIGKFIEIHTSMGTGMCTGTCGDASTRHRRVLQATQTSWHCMAY